MADVPFLGSKISLISKSDIRYEGILYSVDAKESTIALSKVKSYGTETRGDPTKYVAPKNEVFDIIIFRASDVKDLRVDAPQPPGLSDPAIISAHHSYPGPIPSTSSIKNSNSGLPKPKEIKEQNERAAAAAAASVDNERRQGGAGNERRAGGGNERRGAGGGGGGGDRRGGGDGRPANNTRVSRSAHDNNRFMRYNNNNNNNSNGHQNHHPNQHQHQNHNNNNNNYNNYRRGPNNRDNNSKGGGPVNRRGPMQGRRGRSRDRTGAPRGPRKGAPLKFDAEYDFVKANKLFLELEGKLRGMKIKDDEKDGAESSGDGANSKSPTGQSESGSGYDSDDQNHGDSKDVESNSGEFYDKTKSFFDNISCEASERSQGKVNKPDWRKERQLNAETFGVSANYRRGGYRGRVYGANGYHRR